MCSFRIAWRSQPRTARQERLMASRRLRKEIKGSAASGRTWARRPEGYLPCCRESKEMIPAALVRRNFALDLDGDVPNGDGRRLGRAALARPVGNLDLERLDLLLAEVAGGDDRVERFGELLSRFL